MTRAVERRRRTRFPLHLQANIRRQGGNEQFRAETENLSCDGLCFRSEESLALGEVLEIRLDLDGVLGTAHGRRCLICLARIVQAESDDASALFRYGCEILDYGLETFGAAAGRRSDAALVNVAAS